MGAQQRDTLEIIKPNKYFNKLAVWVERLKKCANPNLLLLLQLQLYIGVGVKKKMCVCPASRQRQENEQIYPRTSSTPLSVCPSLSLFTEFTHHLHLSKKSFKFLKVERRATVGGTATGGLSKPEHCVKNLGDIDSRMLVNTHTHTHRHKKAQWLLTFFILRLQSESLMTQKNIFYCI